MFGNIPRIPGVLPTLAPRPAFSVPAAEDRLMAYSDIDVWMQPDLGNARQVGKFLTVAGRKGRYAISASPSINLGMGMQNGVETITMQGGNISGQQPMHVPDYEITGDYFVALVLRWSPAIALSGTAYQLFSAGVDGDTSSLEVYMLNNVLFQRHGGSGQNGTQSGLFVPGASCLVWATYDAARNKGALGVNSLNPLPLAAEALSGPAGRGRGPVIGGKWNAGGIGGLQIFNGQIRAAFIGRKAWYAPEKALMRQTFLSDLGSLYGADFSMS